MSVTVNLPRVPVGQVRVSLPRATPAIVTVTREVVVQESSERDNLGGVVPTWLAQSFAYDTSNNLQTITVSDGDTTWVRSYEYSGGNQTADSGWVRQ